MRIQFTRKPTLTKALIVAAVFGIVYLATTSNLPSCSDPNAALNAALNGGECIERQSLLHTWSGWLAIISLLTGVALFLMKQYRAYAASSQASAPPPQSPVWPEAPVPAWTAPPAPQAYGTGEPVTAAPQARPGPGQPVNFCAGCGTPAVTGDTACRHCLRPYKAAR